MAHKSTAAVASALQTDQTAKAVANSLKSSHGGVRFCCFCLLPRSLFNTC